MGVLTIDPKKLATGFSANLDEVQTWREDNVLAEFRALVKRPPLRSIVADIHPAAATLLLRESNSKNRPLSKTYVAILVEMYDKTQDGVTGDTIKVGKSGLLIDGQHRLTMASNGKAPFRTHIVFGIDDKTFDIIDQGRRRTAGDVLAIDMVPNYQQTANAVRWVYVFGHGRTTNLDMGESRRRFTPRAVRAMVRGELSELPRWAAHGQRIKRAFGIPPAMVQAMCFLIGRYDPKMAERFIEDWVSGARTGPNKTFDVMQTRINTIKGQNNGRISHMMRAAFIVTAFNYWRQNETAPARAFSWSRGYAFPKMAVPMPKFLTA